MSVYKGRKRIMKGLATKDEMDHVAKKIGPAPDDSGDEDTGSSYTGSSYTGSEEEYISQQGDLEPTDCMIIMADAAEPPDFSTVFEPSVAVDMASLVGDASMIQFTCDDTIGVYHHSYEEAFEESLNCKK